MKKTSFRGNFFLKFLCAKVFALICVLTLSVGAMKATNYCRIRVVAVGVEGGTVYAGKWSGWSTSFPSDRSSWPSDFTTEVLDFSSNPDVEIVAWNPSNVDFVGWYRDEACTNLITATEMEKNIYGSSSGVAVSSSIDNVPVTTFYAKFSTPAADWASLGAPPAAGKYYIYNLGYGGFISWYSSTSTSMNLSKDHNNAILFTLESGSNTNFIASRNGNTYYVNKYGTSLESTSSPTSKTIEAGDGFYYVNLNYNSNYWDAYTGGSLSYDKRNTGKQTQRWLFIPEDSFNSFVSVESLNANGSVSITESPTATGTAYVKFDVSEVGPASVYEYALSGGDGNWELGTPMRSDNVLIVPVIYTAQNIHTGTTPASTITVTVTDPASHSVSGTATAYVDLQPKFEMAVDALDWSYDADGETLLETYYQGMEVAASQRDRLQNKLVYVDANTTGVAKNNATWTATIIGEDKNHFKFANGTQTVSGSYSANLMDVIFAPTATKYMHATLHIETSYTDAADHTETDVHEIALSGEGNNSSMVMFTAAGHENGSEDESYSFGDITGTNSKSVTAELFMVGLTSPDKVWSDPAGVFEFDPNTIDFGQMYQTLTFTAHPTTPVTTATDYTATLTISGTGSSGAVTGVLTLTYHALPLLTPEVTWNWENIDEYATSTNPLSTTSDGEWTLEYVSSDVDVTYNAEVKSVTTPYLHHEPGKTVTFKVTIPQTDTYAALEQTLVSTIKESNPIVWLTTTEQFNDPSIISKRSFEKFDESKHELYIDYGDNVYFFTNGQSKMTFDYRDKGTTTWTIKEYFSDNSYNTIINNSALPAGSNEIEFSHTAVKIHFYGSGSGGYFTDVRYFELDYITLPINRVVLVNDNGIINNLDVTASVAKKELIVSLNAAAQEYFELQSDGKATGSSISFDGEDGLAPHQELTKVITIAVKEGVNTEAAKTATSGDACQVIFADGYTYNHEEHSLPINLIDAYDVTFKHHAHGTYTATYTSDMEHPHDITDADYVPHFTTTNPTLCEVTLSAPTPESGYIFQGWKINDVVTSFLASYTVVLAEATIVEPVFVQGEGYFSVDNAYFEGLNEAVEAATMTYADQPIVTVAQDVLLDAPATYTIPNGVTLLVPKDDVTGVQTEHPNVIYYANAAAVTAANTRPSAYRKMILRDGVTLHVEAGGAICLAANIATTNGGHKSAFVTGNCGVIDMSAGGHIELDGTLYCWGFIKGQDMDQGNNTQDVGTVTANNGSVIWENFAVGDWRGGSATSEIAFWNSQNMLFPFQSYSIQNVEVPTTYKYGSMLRTYTDVYGDGHSNGAGFSMVGPANTLFLLKDEGSYVRKWYDPTTDLICYELSGTAQLDALHITVMYEVSSENFNLPISNSMHIILKDCNMTLAKPIMVQAGAVMEIKESATVNLENNLYMYDKDDWGLYIHNYYFRSFNNMTLHKDRGAENSKAGLDDAKFIVDGTLNVVSGKGYLYSTTGGADIMGNGGGKIVFAGALPTESTIYQVTVSGSSPYVNWVEVPVAAANLHNEDGSYTNSNLGDGGGFITFHNINGRWFADENKTELEDHTYDFAYLDNGNSGDDVWTSAVYSHDKTGLDARMKWFNVVKTKDNCTDPIEDLEEVSTSNWWLGSNPTAYYNYTMLGAWNQFLPTEAEGVYSGSDNVLYQKDGCEWIETGSVDENCLYTFYEGGYPVKKALVDGHFIPLASNGYDPAYHKADAEDQYYICFQGCNWHAATPYVGESKAYTIAEGGDYIWFNNDWLRVDREGAFFYTADEQTNVKTYYEYLNGEWVIATPYVSVTDDMETREFYYLHEAVNVASYKNNATITILRDMQNVATTSLYETQNNNCTLDLNGHTVTGAINKLITINAPGSTFTIKSTVPGGVLKMTGKPNNTCYYNVYVNAGNLVLEENATIAVDNPDTYVGDYYALCAVRVLAGTSFTMNGGAISARVHRRAYGIESNGTTTLNAGTITCQTLGYAYPYGVQVKAGTTTIKDGVTITCTAGSTYAHPVMQTAGTLNITGGIFRSYVKTQTSFSGAIRVDGGTATISNATLYAEATGTGSNSKNAYGVYSKGTTTLTNCTVSGITKSSAGYGVEVAGGTTTIVSGSYKGKTVGVHKSSGTLSIQGGYYSHNTNLSGNLAANRGVFETNDTEKAQYGSDMNYKVLEAYTITFMNGENQLQSGVQAKGTTPTYSGAEPTKAATELATYAFDGWSLTNDGDLLGSLPTVTAAATYYAHFTVLEGKYKVTFDATTNGGTTDIANSYIVEGEAVGTLPTATKTGYTFNGWFTEATGGEEITSATIPTESVTYYAQFTVNTYTLTWNLEGGAISVAGTPAGPVAYGTALTAPTVTKTGYTFVTWTPTVAATMPAAAATYTASWTPKTNTAYKVIHKLQNPENLEEYIVDATENLSGTTGAYVAPKPKTTYVGYITPNEVAPTQILADGSLEIIYLYDCISYTISFDATTNGGECATASLNVLHGATLTLPEATRDGYTFDGWFTKAVGGDQITNSTVIQRNIGTLYAQFTEAITQETNIIAGKSGDADGVDVVITDQGVVAHSLIIEKDGRVNITPSASVSVDDFVLESNGSQSGQLLGSSSDRLSINEHAYFDLTLNAQRRTWYAVAVPWAVDCRTGISIKGGRKLVLGRDFDLVYYQGDVRASQGAGYQCWKYAEDADGDKIMHPGRAYMMYFGSEIETIRFENYDDTPFDDAVLTVGQYDASEAGDANWNGVANPMTYHATLAAGGATYGYYLNNGRVDEYMVGEGEPTYKLVNLASFNAIVGKPLFIQAVNTTPISTTPKIAAAPRRIREIEIEEGIETVYEVTFGAENSANKDNIFIQTVETKEDGYVIGQDLLKAGYNAKFPQMWVNRYGKRLSVNSTTPENGVHEYPLTLNIPQAGAYTIAIESTQGDTESLYLTKNGNVIWNLSNGEYTGTFEKGTDVSYSLRTAAKAPMTPTSVDEAVVDAQGEIKKVIINDQVFIIRGNQVYSIDGQLVK